MIKIDSDFTKVYEELSQINEAKRVIHDIDVLYHYTNPTPFLKIFTGDCLRADVKLKAVCLTTDRNYQIYGYPCGIQFSRKRLEADGYDLVPVDEFADDIDAEGESEERIYKSIESVSKYVTAVHIYWQGRFGAEISIVQSLDGDRIADAEYDEQGNEYENYELRLKDFRALLNELKTKGIKVIEHGSPISGEYYLDAEGELQYGQLPMSIAN